MNEQVEAALATLEALAEKWERIASVDHGLQNGYVHRDHAAAIRAAIRDVPR